MNAVSYMNQIVLSLRVITTVLTVTVVVVAEQQESLRTAMKYGVAQVSGSSRGLGGKVNGGM